MATLENCSDVSLKISGFVASNKIWENSDHLVKISVLLPKTQPENRSLVKNTWFWCRHRHQNMQWFHSYSKTLPWKCPNVLLRSIQWFHAYECPQGKRWGECFGLLVSFAMNTVGKYTYILSEIPHFVAINIMKHLIHIQWFHAHKCPIGPLNR